MSDLQKFIELYASVGIALKPEPKEHNWPEEFPTAAQYLTLHAGGHDGKTEKTIGYGGFYTSIFFDADGKFVGQGVWE